MKRNPCSTTTAAPGVARGFEQRLRDAGVAPTRQRLAIAGVLLDRPQHLCAEDVLARLREGAGGRVSKATVYNTLGLFARAGLVREVIAAPGRTFYDSNVTAHHHLYDVDAGTLTDVEPGCVVVGEVSGIPAALEVQGVDVIVRVRQRCD